MNLGKVIEDLYPRASPWVTKALWTGVVDLPTPSTPLADEIVALSQQRLAGLAVEAAQHVADPDSVAALRQAAFAAVASSIEVTRAGAALCELLAESGFDPVVVKGPTIASQWRSPHQRAFTDLDVFVSPSRYREALDLMASTGYVQDIANELPWRSMQTLCREGTNLARGPYERVDLHQRVPPWSWSEQLTHLVVNGPRQATFFGGTVLPSVPAEVNFLIACLHVISDRSKPGDTLIIWRDLAELYRVVDLERLRALAVETGLSGWVRMIVMAIPVRTPLRDLLDMMPDQPIRHRGRLAVIARRRTHLQRLPIDLLFRLPASRALVYAAGVVVPSPRYLHRRYGSVRAGLRGWWFGPVVH